MGLEEVFNLGLVRFCICFGVWLGCLMILFYFIIVVVVLLIIFGLIMVLLVLVVWFYDDDGLVWVIFGK